MLDLELKRGSKNKSIDSTKSIDSFLLPLSLSPSYRTHAGNKS